MEEPLRGNRGTLLNEGNSLMRFNGSDYDRSQDDGRLSKQHLRVQGAMSDASWKTLSEIAAITKDPEASISAQLRHLRKPRFGSWIVEKRARGDRANGLYEYRLLRPKSVQLEFSL